MIMAGDKQGPRHLKLFHSGVNGPFGLGVGRVSSQHWL